MKIGDVVSLDILTLSFGLKNIKALKLSPNQIVFVTKKREEIGGIFICGIDKESIDEQGTYFFTFD